MSEYQVTYNDNVEINGKLKTDNIDVNTNGVLNAPSVNAGSIALTNNLTSTNGNITTTNGTLSGNTITGTNMTASNNIAATNGSLIGNVKSDLVDPNTANGTTIISKPKIPTSLTVSNPVYVPLLDSTGILGLLSASLGSNGQVLSTDGTNISWQSVSGGGGSASISGWATLTEKLQNSNNAIYYNGTNIVSSSSLGTSAQTTNYNRVFTNIVNSTTNPIVSTNSASYTNASTTYTCYYNFTLGSGTYIISGSFPSGIPSSGNSSFIKHRVNLESSSSVILYGTSEVTKAVSKSILNGVITLNTNTQLLVKHYIYNDNANLGLPFGSGVEIYGVLTIIKLA